MMGRDARRVFIVVIALTVSVVAGCDTAKRVVGELHDLNALSADVGAAFDEPNVSVNLNNGRYLTIGLVNSKRAGLSADEKRLLAKRVADFVYAHYNSHDTLEKVNVAFVKHVSFLVFNYTDSTDVYGFDSETLRGSPK